MPASPPPQAIPIPGIDRTYSMAQPMANTEPPSKSYKQATSIVAKARAVVRTHKGIDAPVVKGGNGRDQKRDKVERQALKRQLSQLDAEVSLFPAPGDSYADLKITSKDHVREQADQTTSRIAKPSKEGSRKYPQPNQSQRIVHRIRDTGRQRFIADRSPPRRLFVIFGPRNHH